MKLTDFDIFHELYKTHAGWDITLAHNYMLETRLAPVIKKWGFANIPALAAALIVVPEKELITDVINAMAIHETAFFRDVYPFQFLRDHMLDYLLKARKKQKHVRIWSAGCSSGQEAYTLAILLKNMQSSHPDWRFEILATDVSTKLLKKAERGIYSQSEAQNGLPAASLIQHFTQDGENWVANDDLKGMITFRPFNLMDDTKPLGHFDIILCRNVLRYFDAEARGDVLSRITAQCLADDGFMMLGRDEGFSIQDDDRTSISAMPCISVEKSSPYLSAFKAEKTAQALA